MDDRVDPDPSVKKRVLRALVNIKNQLEEKRKNINTEIGNYPAPIPACDAQFNYLIAPAGDVVFEQFQKNILFSFEVAIKIRACEAGFFCNLCK